MRLITVLMLLSLLLTYPQWTHSQSNKELRNIVRDQDSLQLGVLLANGFDINSLYRSYSGKKDANLLNQAILYQRRDLAEFILKQPGVKIQVVQRNGWTTLHHLVYNGWYDIAEEHILSGVDINTLGAKDMHILRMVLRNYGRPDFDQAEHQSEGLAFLKFLYGHGIDPELSISCCRKETTILALAATVVDSATMKFLIDQHRAEIDIADHKGMTPLHRAVWQNRKDVLQVLLEQGAVRGLIDNRGRTPMDMARKSGYLQLVEVLE